jgi:hypothetical protein
MKPTLCLLLFCFLFSCRKEALSTKDFIVGKWELRKTFGGWTGTTTYQAGNGNILEFTKTNFSSYSNGQLNESGSYSIVKDTTMDGSLEDRVIYYGISTGPKMFVRIDGEKLNFSLHVVDGGGSEYERVN